MTPQEFIENESFRRWVYAQHPDDTHRWTDYLYRHPEQQESADAARQFLLSARGELPIVSDEQVSRAVDQLMGRVQAKPVQRLRLHNPGRTFARVAAMLVLLLLTAGLAKYGYDTRPAAVASAAQIRQPATNQTDLVNGQKTPRLVKLPDGSLVVLQPNARLRFVRNFSRRDVSLTGSAFFEVVKNPKKPFRVLTDALTTEVLGTSFSVNAPTTGGPARVIVKSGRVLVSANPTARQPDAAPASVPDPHNADNTVMLLPNQQATVTRGAAAIAKITLPAASSVAKNSASTPSFQFRRTPLPVVFATLERAYGIAIRFDPNLLTTCTLTARLDEGTLFDKLDIIAASTGSSYTLQNGQLVIRSAGCR